MVSKTVTTRALQDRILARRTRIEKLVRQELVKPTPIKKTVDVKTSLMKYLETFHGCSIEELLIGETQQEVADKLGITQTCVLRWRRRLGIVEPDRRRKDNGN